MVSQGLVWGWENSKMIFARPGKTHLAPLKLGALGDGSRTWHKAFWDAGNTHLAHLNFGALGDG